VKQFTDVTYVDVKVKSHTVFRYYIHEDWRSVVFEQFSMYDVKQFADVTCVDGKLYHVKVKSHTVFRYYIHEDWRSVVFEQVSTYDVNGVKGYGIFEFLYRSVVELLTGFICVEVELLPVLISGVKS